MGYFDGLTAITIRQEPDGRRYYAPLGKFGKVYEVPGEEASQLVQERWKTFYVVLFAALFGLVLLSDSLWRTMIVAPLAGLLAVPFSVWAARGLPVASIRYADLHPVTRAEVQKTYSVATGRKALGFVLTCSVLMAVLSLCFAIISSDKWLWLGTGFFGFCSVSAYRSFRQAKP